MTIKYRRMAVFGIPWHPHPPHHLRSSHQKVLAHYCFSPVLHSRDKIEIFCSFFTSGSVIAEIFAVSYAIDLNFRNLKSFEICNRNHLFPPLQFSSSSSFNICLECTSNRASQPPEYKHGIGRLSYSSDNFLQQSCFIFQNLSEFIGFFSR